LKRKGLIQGGGVICCYPIAIHIIIVSNDEEKIKDTLWINDLPLFPTQNMK
jgi:hypothetical protein